MGGMADWIGTSMIRKEIWVSGDIPDIFIKDEFENKSKSDWIALKKKYNANYVATPSEWKIKLDLLKSNKFYAIYKIQ